MEIKKVTVLGSGTMGRQIALLCAIRGYETVCYDISEEILEKMNSWLETYLAGRIAKGRLTAEQVEETKARFSSTVNFEEAVKDADLVIEAALEQLELKKKIFADLDRYTKPEAILTTNSSMIGSSKMAEMVANPGRVCNLHFSNPALVMEAVEIVCGEHTSADTKALTCDFVRSLGRKPVVVLKETEGFCINAITTAIFRATWNMLDQGVASPEDIDIAAKGALGHPMGPCELLDMTGLDLEYDVWKNRYERTGREEDRIPRTLMEMYERGEYGRKSGKGFYEYTK